MRTATPLMSARATVSAPMTARAHRPSAPLTAGAAAAEPETSPVPGAGTLAAGAPVGVVLPADANATSAVSSSVKLPRVPRSRTGFDPARSAVSALASTVVRAAAAGTVVATAARAASEGREVETTERLAAPGVAGVAGDFVEGTGVVIGATVGGVVASLRRVQSS